MSDVASTVKEIIVEKLGVKESEVTPKQTLRMTSVQILWTLSK